MVYKQLKPPGPRWPALMSIDAQRPKPQPGDRVLLRNDEEDVVKAYNEAFKMFTLHNHHGQFSADNLLVITETKK